MKFRHLMLGAVIMPALLASAASKPILTHIELKQQKAVFEAATSQLDANGDYYSFQNVSSLTKYAKYLPVMIQKALLANDIEKEDALRASEIARVAVQVLNPAVLKALASSSAEMEANVYRAKSYAYLGKKGMKAPSFFDLTGKVNHKLNWQALPADTRFALDTDFYPGLLYTRAIEALKKSSDPSLSAIPDQLAQLKQQGIDLEKDLAAVTHFSLIVVGSSAQNWGVILTLADETGTIAEQLKLTFPPAEGTNIVPLPLPIAGCTPAISYGDKKIILTSNKELLTRSVPAKLGDVSQMRKFASYLPGEGTGYFYLNLDQETSDTLKALLAQTEQGKLGAKLISPFTFLAVSGVTEEGCLSTAVSDFSVAQATAKLSVAMPLIALISNYATAQKNGKKVVCMANMKQLGLALSLYAKDHENTLPKTLKELETEEYLAEGAALVCPVSKKEYVFVGAGMKLDKIQTPATFPLLLGAPGCKEGAGVLFADGHVEFIPLAGYQTPAQLIGVLNQRHQYSPEQLDALLKAVSAK